MTNVAEVLAVDDDDRNLLTLEASLRQMSFGLQKARSGSEALRLLLEREFACIILDIQMPDMDGYETARLIRSRDRTRHIPIIFLTAHQRSEDEVEQGYQLGVVDYLVKPVSVEILKSKLAVFVDLYRRREEARRHSQLLRDAEARAHARELAEARQRFEAERMRAERDQQRRESERLALVAESASGLLRADNPIAVLPAVFERLQPFLDVDMYLYHRVEFEPSPPRLLLESHGGIGAVAASSFDQLAFVPGPLTDASIERRPVISSRLTENTLDESSAALRRIGIWSYASFPLIARDRLLGLLGFGRRREAPFGPEQVSVLDALIQQVASALERARLLQELARRADALAEADRRKNEFLAMLAHELRNPLAPIRAALGVFEQRMHSDDPVVQRARDAMDRQVSQMVRLLDDLLDVSRITANKIELRRSPIALGEVIEQAVQTSRPLMDKRGHGLLLECDGTEGLIVNVDGARLTQVISNLLNNSARYTPDGGDIRLCVAVADGTLKVSVRDNGRGIRPELLPRIFEVFVQSDRAEERIDGGLGVGLSLVKRLIELHGGTVMADSPGEGLGSTFEVTIPHCVVDSTARPAETRRVNGRSRSLKIVLVDDNPDIRQTLSDFLQAAGHEVRMAEDGPSGVRCVLDTHPDLALIDLGLPGMSGLEVARKVREAQNGSRPRLVAVTGYGQAEDRERALASGFDDHLVKPLDPDSIRRVLMESADDDDTAAQPG